MAKGGQEVYRFGAFSFAPDSLELFRDGVAVQLPVQSAKILKILLSNAGSMVGRDTIREAVWSDRYVDFDAGLNSEIKKIRRALGDDAADPVFVETVPRRGYRFIAELQRSSDAPRVGKLSYTMAAVFVIAALGIGLFWTLEDSDTFVDPENAPSAYSEIGSPAYDAHLKGRVALRTQDVAVAEQYFLSAIEADPEFVHSYTGLARTAIARRSEGWHRIRQAIDLVEKALEIEPKLVEARTMLAGIQLYYGRRPLVAADLLDNLIEEGVDFADVFVTQAYQRTIGGDTGGSVESAERAYRSDPMSPTLNANYGWIYYKARRYTDAERLCKTSHDLAPDREFALECVIHVNHSQQDYAEAADYGLRLMAVRGASTEEIAAIRAIDGAAGREAAYWRWTANWLENEGAASIDALSSLGIAHAIIGDGDAAVRAFDQAFKKGGEAFLAFLAVDPRVDALRSHPEFDRLAQLSRQPYAPE